MNRRPAGRVLRRRQSAVLNRTSCGRARDSRPRGSRLEAARRRRSRRRPLDGRPSGPTASPRSDAPRVAVLTDYMFFVPGRRRITSSHRSRGRVRDQPRLLRPVHHSPRGLGRTSRIPRRARAHPRRLSSSTAAPKVNGALLATSSRTSSGSGSSRAVDLCPAAARPALPSLGPHDGGALLPAGLPLTTATLDADAERSPTGRIRPLRSNRPTRLRAVSPADCSPGEPPPILPDHEAGARAWQRWRVSVKNSGCRDCCERF